MITSDEEEQGSENTSAVPNPPVPPVEEIASKAAKEEEIQVEPVTGESDQQRGEEQTKEYAPPSVELQPVEESGETVQQTHQAPQTEEEEEEAPLPLIKPKKMEASQEESEEEEEEERSKKKARKKKTKRRRRSHYKAKLYGSMRKAPWEAYTFITEFTLDLCSPAAESPESLAACIENHFSREVIPDLDPSEIAVVKKYRFLGVEVPDLDVIAYPIFNPIYSDFDEINVDQIADIDRLRKLVKTYKTMVEDLQERLEMYEKKISKYRERIDELEDELEGCKRKCGWGQLVPHTLGLLRDAVKSHAEVTKERVRAEAEMKQAEVAKEFSKARVTVADIGDVIKTIVGTVREFTGRERSPPPPAYLPPPPPPPMPQGQQTQQMPYPVYPYPYYYYPYPPPPPPPQYANQPSQQTGETAQQSQQTKSGEKEAKVDGEKEEW